MKIKERDKSFPVDREAVHAEIRKGLDSLRPKELPTEDQEPEVTKIREEKR